MFASPSYGHFAPPRGAWVSSRRHRAAVALVLAGATLCTGASLGAWWLQRSVFRAEPTPAVDAAPVETTASIARPLDIWRDLPEAPRRFSMQKAAFGDVTGSRVRLRDDGSRRQDLLTLGAYDADTGLLHLAITRPAPDVTAANGFFVTLVRAAAAEGLAVLRSDLPGTVATRYGVMEVAEMTVARGGASRACTGYRLRSSAPDLQMAGFACDVAGQAPSRDRLVCSLETLTLLPGEADREFANFFTAAAFRHSPGCVKPADVTTPTASVKPDRPAARKARAH